MGYFGGIVLLLGVYVGFIAGDGPLRGLLAIPTADGWNIRLVALVAAVWFAVFAVPMLVAVPETPPASGRRPPAGIAASYRALLDDLRVLYRADRHTVWFLGASALYRDGLAAVFTFGAVLAVTVYGIGQGDVLVFGVVANVVSAVGALTAGRIDDRTGPKSVIVGSLLGMIACAVVLLFVSGPAAFWVFGLGLCLFVGPAQSSSRPICAASPRPAARARCSASTPPQGGPCRSSPRRWWGCSPTPSARTGPGSSGSSWCSRPGSRPSCRCDRRSTRPPRRPGEPDARDDRTGHRRVNSGRRARHRGVTRHTQV